MGSYISARMVHALELVKSGMTAYAAAKIAGVEANSIYRCKQYKEWQKKRHLAANSANSLQEYKPC